MIPALRSTADACSPGKIRIQRRGDMADARFPFGKNFQNADARKDVPRLSVLRPRRLTTAAEAGSMESGCSTGFTFADFLFTFHICKNTVVIEKCQVEKQKAGLLETFTTYLNLYQDIFDLWEI